MPENDQTAKEAVKIANQSVDKNQTIDHLPNTSRNIIVVEAISSTMGITNHGKTKVTITMASLIDTFQAKMVIETTTETITKIIKSMGIGMAEVTDTLIEMTTAITNTMDMIAVKIIVITTVTMETTTGTITGTIKANTRTGKSV